MFKIRKLRPGALSLLLATAAPTVHAATDDNPWGLQFFAGDSTGTHGDFSDHSVLTVPDLGVIDPALAGTSGKLAFDTLPYDDIYRSRYVLGAEVSYSFNENFETYGRFSYNPLNGETRRVGILTNSDESLIEPVDAHFHDGDVYSLMMGARYYVPTGNSWRVFGGAALGATRLPELSGSLDISADSVSMPDLRFAKATTVFSQSLQAGVDFRTPSSVDWQLSIGAEHSGAAQAGDDPRLAALGFDTTHAGDDRWSFPITLGATYRF